MSPDLTEAASRIPHKLVCPSGRLTVVAMPQGDEAVRCTACGRWALLDPEQDTRHQQPESRPAPEPEPVRVTWGYCCRAHQSNRVNWRGRGCKQCREEERQRQEERDRERIRARLARVQPEEQWAYV